MKKTNSINIAAVRRNLAMAPFSQRSGELRTEFLNRLHELTGEAANPHYAGMTPKGQNNIWERPNYIPPNTTPTRAGADEHMQYKRVGLPT